MWESVALGITVAVLASFAFVGGCFCGSWVQRSIGYVIRTRAEKELLDQASERAQKDYGMARKGAVAGIRKAHASDAMADLERAMRGDRPMGPPSPSPSDIGSPEELDDLEAAISASSREPRDWVGNLGTERLRAMGDG